MRHLAKRWADGVRRFLIAPILDVVEPVRLPDAGTQLQRQLHYRRLMDEGRSLPALADIGFKTYSQADEDGILLFLFALLGSGSKRCVEICAGRASVHDLIPGVTSMPIQCRCGRNVRPNSGPDPAWLVSKRPRPRAERQALHAAARSPLRQSGDL